MDINKAKGQVKDTVNAYLAQDEVGAYRIPLAKQRPLFLVGAPGIGKTAIMAQVAQEMGIGLVSYSMTHHTRQSALGLPHIVHHTYEDLEYDASEYTMSEIVAAIYDYMERTGLKSGILFLDEINCVSETLYPSMLQFLQFKTFGQHRIPDNWVVVCAGNPPEYNRSVHEFDIVTLDRLRKMEVEPDLAAWHAYAVDHGVHPAIISFLDIKKDRFYAVESTPSGKVFVTARGWEDLSETMKVFDEMGIPIDLPLIEQFIQKQDIAEDFYHYYELFKKYRSDYQIDGILDGTVTADIKERARGAAFDERLALLGLILDRITGDCESVLEKEGVVASVREILRSVKDPLLGGASLDDTLGMAIQEAEADLARGVQNDTLSVAAAHEQRTVIARLKELYQTCLGQGTTEGSAAFDTIHYSYRGLVADLEQGVKTVQSEFDNAFAFLDDVFEEEREGLVFITELTSRKATSQFVSKFNSESYYQHNEGLMVDGHKEVLLTRIDELLGAMGDLPADEVQETAVSENVDMSPEVRAVEDMHLEEPRSTAATTAVAEVASAAVAAVTASAASSVSPADVVLAVEEAVAEASEAAVDEAELADRAAYTAELADYYADSALEYGFTSLCKMTLPENLGGKRILDIGCRRGRGVFKLSSRVGNSGFVVGLDWVPEYIEEATSRMDRAWQDSNLAANNMDFRLGYPEDLQGAQIPDESFDIVFINNVFNLAQDKDRVLREFYRVLKPGGMVILETVFADGARNQDVVKAARSIGNSIQAAPAKDDLVAKIAGTGFKEIVYLDEHPVKPSDGALPDKPVPVVDADEDATFQACVMHLIK